MIGLILDYYIGLGLDIHRFYPVIAKGYVGKAPHKLIRAFSVPVVRIIADGTKGYVAVF